METDVQLELYRADILGLAESVFQSMLGLEAVSYTHLTLPTNREV